MWYTDPSEFCPASSWASATMGHTWHAMIHSPRAQHHMRNYSYLPGSKSCQLDSPQLLHWTDSLLSIIRIVYYLYFFGSVPSILSPSPNTITMSDDNIKKKKKGKNYPVFLAGLSVELSYPSYKKQNPKPNPNTEPYKVTVNFIFH